MIRYRAAPAATLRVEPLDALTLIYHRSSGITHLVDSPVPEILGFLNEPMDVEALLAKLAAEFDLIDPNADALTARVEELVESGLVERL